MTPFETYKGGLFKAILMEEVCVYFHSSKILFERIELILIFASSNNFWSLFSARALSSVIALRYRVASLNSRYSRVGIKLAFNNPWRSKSANQDWCRMVAMESTSVYWKPLVNIFEMRGLKYIIVNARDYKAVPSRKADVLDSAWLADLLRHGLLKASFIPTRE